MSLKTMKPSHPGAILAGVINGLREETGKALTIREIADGLGVNRSTLSSLLNEKTGVSPEMAVKLSEAFETKADLWLNLQKQYDLWLAEQKVSRQSITHFITSESAKFALTHS